MFERHALKRVEEALQDTPVVLIHGPRQAGKSTLATQVSTQTSRASVTLDDPLALALAQRERTGFFGAYPPPVTVDEVQRAPELFLPMKLLVDRNRVPGSFLLTGSANVLLLPKLSDSLAGRMEVVDLLPLSQGEIEGTPDGFVDGLFSDSFTPKIAPEGEEALIERILRGGFPEAVQRSSRRRNDWFENYVRTILDRDVRDLANVEALSRLPLLLSALANRSSETLNLLSLSIDVGLPYTTLRRYVSLLETIFMVKTIPAWSTKGGKSLAKTPKAYISDTGLLAFLTRMDAKLLSRDRLRFSSALDNFVAMELVKQCANGELRPRLMHLRTVRHLQVPFVLESRGLDIAGVDINPGPNLHSDDADGLRFLQELAGPRFARGVVLYGGSEVVPLDDKIVAMPFSALWRSE